MMRKIENDLLKEGKFAYRKNGCLVLENEGVKITALYKEVNYAHIIVECANSNWQDHLDDIEDILDRLEKHSLGRLLTEIYVCDGQLKKQVDQRHYQSDWHM